MSQTQDKSISMGEAKPEGTSSALSRSRGRAVLVMGCASFFFTLQTLVIKLTAAHLSVWQVGFGRFALGLAVVILISRFTEIDLWGVQRGLLIVRGILGALAYICFVAAIQMLPLSQGLVLFYLFPVFAFLMAPWINRESLQLRDLVWVLIAFSGVVFILMAGPGRFIFGWGHLLALVAGGLAGVVMALIRKLRVRNNSITPYFYFCLCGLPICLFMLLLPEQSVIPDRVGLWGLLIASASAFIAQVTMNVGLKYLPAAIAGVILTGEVITAGAFGVIFLEEPLTWRLLLGASLILYSSWRLNRGMGKAARLQEQGD